MAKRKLTDGYIIQLIRQGSSLTVEDIKEHPDMIGVKRVQIQIKRYGEEMENKNSTSINAELQK